MALSFPLDRQEFFEELCPISVTFNLGEAVEASETSGGEILRSDYGARLWYGTVTLKPEKPILIEDIMVLIRVLQESRASFILWPASRSKAYAEPTVSIPTGKINTLPSNRTITLKDLPAGFVITRGDFLSFTYLSGPTRYAFHQAVEGITANGSGVTSAFEISPAIRPGAAVDADVRLNKPILKAVMVPNSLQIVELPKRGWASGASFAWRQTLR